MALSQRIMRLKTRHTTPRKTHPRSPFLAGTGVAYNEA